MDLAQVALLRAKPAGIELFVVRRGGMGAFTLPGGAIHTNEDPRIAAARVLFEDVGVLIGRDAGATATTLEMPSVKSLRKRIGSGANATQALREVGMTWASDSMFAWSTWQAPSSAGLSSPGIRIDGGKQSSTETRVFVAALPIGFQPSFEDASVESSWLLAREAEARGDELLLPPHVIRTCWELANFDKLADVVAASRARMTEPHAILPRVGPNLTLLLPWDPAYATAGQGESSPFTYHPKWALGPSRFVREDRTWKLVSTPKA